MIVKNSTTAPGEGRCRRIINRSVNNAEENYAKPEDIKMEIQENKPAEKKEQENKVLQVQSAALPIASMEINNNGQCKKIIQAVAMTKGIFFLKVNKNSWW